MSIFRQTPRRGLARRTCRYCASPASLGDTCEAHAGEAGRLLANPRRAGYRSSAYRIARRAALARAAGRCERCGRELPLDELGRPVCQTHHVDDDPTNNPPDGSNLEVCCCTDPNPCHRGSRNVR